MTDTTTALRIVCGHDSRSVVGCLPCEAADLITQLRAHIAEQRAAPAPAGEPTAEMFEAAGNLDAFVAEYIDNYEMADYTPTASERAIIMDAVMGLLAEPEFIAAFATSPAPAEALAALESLRAFALAIMTDWPDVGIDGADLQDLGIKHGLLELKMPKPTEPCGENCNCAAYFADDEWADGIECYRLTALVTAPCATAAAPAGEPPASLQGEAVALAEHDLGIIRDLEAMAADRSGAFWPQMLAVGALRIIRRLEAAAAPAGEPPASQASCWYCGAAAQGDECRKSLADVTCRKGAPAADPLMVLRAIVRECRGPDKPFSNDSYLPPHIVDLAVAALDGDDIERAYRYADAMLAARSKK